MDGGAGERVAVSTDACVLVNFARLDRMDLLGRHACYRFAMAEEVEAEVRWPDQRERMRRCIDAGELEVVAPRGGIGVEDAGGLFHDLGAGEAAALLLALERCWHLATDESGKVRRRLEAALGADRLLTTVDILLACIRSGMLTVEAADGIKAELERQRFRMTFASFREVLGE